MKKFLVAVLVASLISVGIGIPTRAYSNDRTWAKIGKGAAIVSGLYLVHRILSIPQEQPQERIVAPSQQQIVRNQQRETQIQIDPTLGRIENITHIDTVKIWADGQLLVTLNPGQFADVHLDIGKHQIKAQEIVRTIYGPRVVGEAVRTLVVDGRMEDNKYGWTLSFSEGQFRPTY